MAFLAILSSTQASARARHWLAAWQWDAAPLHCKEVVKHHPLQNQRQALGEHLAALVSQNCEIKTL